MGKKTNGDTSGGFITKKKIFASVVALTVITVGALFFYFSIYEEPKMPDLPRWVLEPYVGIGTVGSARIGAAGFQFAKIEATTNARDELSRLIHIKIRNIVKNFVSKTGLGEDQAVDELIVKVQKSLKNIDLSGAVVKKMYVGDEGKNIKKMYLLFVADPAMLTKLSSAIDSAIYTYYTESENISDNMLKKFKAAYESNELSDELSKNLASPEH